MGFSLKQVFLHFCISRSMNTWHQLPRAPRWEISRTKFTSWDTCNLGRNVCLTRKPLSAQCEVPAALPATGGQTPAAYGCPVCAALSLVRHPQPMSATRASPAAGPAPCAAPAAIARTSAPASGDCSVCDTRSLCLQSVWHLQPMPAQCDLPAALACNVCNTRNHWFAMRDTRTWSATCLRHQPWWGCIASGHFNEACSALACWSAKLNGLCDHRRPPYVDLRHGCSWSGPAHFHLNLPSVWHLRTPPACSSGSNFQFLCQILTKYRHGGGARAKP